MIDPDYIDDQMDWHASMMQDIDYLETLEECDSEDTPDVAPSKAKETYWIYAERERGRYRRSTDNSGKWLIFAPADEIDSAWKKVKKLTEQGKLGNSSKVSTHLGNGGRDHVICVYTYDWTDEKDCMAIRETLREAGFTQPLSYKSDEDTLAGRYASKGHKIAKYHV